MQLESGRAGHFGSLTSVLLGSFLVRLSGAATGVMLLFFLSQLHRAGAAQSSAMAAGLLSAAFYLSELVGSPLAGLLIDRRGLRPLLLAGPLLGLAASAIFATPTHFPFLVVARLLQGLTTACTIPAALAFLSNVTQNGGSSRGRTMGFFEVASIGGLAAGYAAGGVLWDSLHRSGFWFMAGVYGLAVGLFVFVRTGEGVRAPARHPTSFAALRRSSDLMAPWLAFNAAAGLWFGQAAYQFSGAHPRLHQLLTSGLPEREIGFIFGAYALLFAAGTICWGMLLGRVPLGVAMRTGAVGLLLATLALGGLNHSEQLAPWGFWLFLGLGIASLGAETAFTPAALTLLAARSDTVRHGRGAVMGVYSMLLAGGQLIGSLVGGVVAERWGVDGLIGATVVLAVIGLVSLPRDPVLHPRTAGDDEPVPSATVA